MGTYTFRWPNACDAVFVTGTFDDWQKTIQLDKVADTFEKTVTLPDTTDKIYYKFVVDGEWTVNQAAAKENDASGIENNVLTSADLVKSAPLEAAIISSVGPGSTTVALAGAVPLEKKDKATETKEMASHGSPVPGAFPETPAATADVEKQFKVSPLPASEGAINPVKLAPGEKIPDYLKHGDVNANVKLDPDSYEKADTLGGASTTMPPVSRNMIPESSLPIAGANDFIINSVGPNSTTAALAGAVPLEPRAPTIVKESQEKAGVDPEASALSSEIREKDQVEAELLSKVPEAPSTAEGTAGRGTDKSEHDKTIAETVAATAATVTVAATAALNSAVDQATAAAAQLPDSVKQKLPVSVQNAIEPTAQETVRQEVSPEVPAEVKESIKEAGQSPEAAANTAAVEEKKKIESELLKEVKVVPAFDDASTKTQDKAVENAAEKQATVIDTPTPGPVEPITKVVKEPEPTAIKAPETPSKKVEPPSAAALGDSPATTEKKKKNRLSTMFSKIKSKVSTKDN